MQKKEIDYQVCPKCGEVSDWNKFDYNLLICEECKKEEEGIMKEFKEQLNQAFRKLVIMRNEWEELDDHERQTVQQVAQETGFDELGDFEEVVDRFKQFYLQMQRTTVIDGYQVWIDDSKRLHICVNNAIWILKDLSQLKTASESDYPSRVDKESLIKIVNWYIDNV